MMRRRTRQSLFLDLIPSSWKHRSKNVHPDAVRGGQGQPVRIDADHTKADSKMRTEQKFREEPRSDQTVGEVAVPQHGLSAELDLSVTEIAVMWILHHAVARQQPSRPLVQSIIDFYPIALAAIRRTDVMRGVRQSDLRLIFFKALITAQTHPKLEMINAIRRADSILEHDAVAPARLAESRHSSAEGLTEDSDTLAHIAVALGHPSRTSPA